MTLTVGLGDDGQVNDEDATELEIEADSDTDGVAETLDAEPLEATDGGGRWSQNHADLPSAEVNVDDQDFLQRVFGQVRDVDFRSPPPPPPRLETGPEKKLSDLRERVRRLERDLARVGSIWSLKQAQVAALDQILAAKEGERAAAVGQFVDQQATIANLRQELEAARVFGSTLSHRRHELEQALQAAHVAHDQAARAAAVSQAAQATALQRAATEQQATVTAHRGALDDLNAAHVVASHAQATVAQAQQQAAQAELGQLREQSAHNVGGLQAQLASRDEQVLQLRQEQVQLQDRIVEREAQVAAEVRRASAAEAEMHRRLGELEARLAASQQAATASDERGEARQRTVQSLGEKLAESEARAQRLEQAAVDTTRGHAAEVQRLEREVTTALGQLQLLRPPQ